MKSVKELHNDLLRLKEEREKLLEAFGMAVKSGECAWIADNGEVVEVKIIQDGLDEDGDIRTCKGYYPPESLFFCAEGAFSEAIGQLQDKIDNLMHELKGINKG